ncbi:GGDEF domain-containing protein [Effusibacillus dendaii]|nr:GGDEF domain-containing protein [Effusibacillus dendaii]
MAYHDTLTSLPNRRLLQEQLEIALFQAESSGSKLALVYFDIDRFKIINDSLGHGTGDLLLTAVEERLSQQLGDSETLARMGGDKFVLLLPGSTVEEAIFAAENIIEQFNRPFYIEDRELHVTTSLEIAIYPNDGTDSLTLLKHADVAMYRA